MIRIFLLGVGLCLAVGCQFTRNMIVDNKGTWFPWHAHRGDPKKMKELNEVKAKWQREDAERREKLGLTGGIQNFQTEK